MRFGGDLTTKALLALEEITQDCRYCVPDRTFAIRFALAYLYALGPGDPEPFVEFWRAISGDNQLFRWRDADMALGRIYSVIGAERSEDSASDCWKIAQARWERHQAGK